MTNTYNLEAKILMNSLNMFNGLLDTLQSAEKKMVVTQMNQILAYFEEHQKEMPIGRSVTSGFYFVEDLSYKGDKDRKIEREQALDTIAQLSQELGQYD